MAEWMTEVVDEAVERAAGCGGDAGAGGVSTPWLEAMMASVWLEGSGRDNSAQRVLYNRSSGPDNSANTHMYWCMVDNESHGTVAIVAAKSTRSDCNRTSCSRKGGSKRGTRLL